MITRRRFLSGTALASLALCAPAVTLASKARQQNRFVLVILRGGLDGLAAVPPAGDPAYRRTREGLALTESSLLDLDGFFGLHPRLVSLHRLFGAGEMAVIHATAPPYSDRSHFDAQNVLESGIATPYAARDGWLYRSLEGLTRNDAGRAAIAIGPSVPLVLRGERSVSSWTPDHLPEPDDDTMARVLDLYERDEALGSRLKSVMATEDMAGDMSAQGRRNNQIGQLASAAARFLSHEDGPRIAVLESGGWDTHANQGAETGILANRLGALDAVLASLKTGLGRHWQSTVVLVVTEFGRTAAMNGTRGTDHGVGGAALLLGGAVRGGQVVTDWPGLGKSDLHGGRDLAPTIDQRQIAKAILADHLGLDEHFLDARVFPDSASAPRLPNLLKKGSG